MRLSPYWPVSSSGIKDVFWTLLVGQTENVEDIHTTVTREAVVVILGVNFPHVFSILSQRHFFIYTTSLALSKQVRKLLRLSPCF